MSTTPTDADQRPHASLSAAVWRYRVHIGTAVIAAVLGALLVSFLLPRQYEATARVLLNERPSGLVGEYLGLGTEDEDHAEVQEGVASSAATLALATELLRGDRSPTALAELAGDVEVEAVNGADVITITAGGSTPDVAADRANAVAEAYRQVTNERLREALDEATEAVALTQEELERQVRMLDAGIEAPGFDPADPTGAARMLALREERLAAVSALSEIQGVEAALPEAAAEYGDGVQQLDTAGAPARPVSPQPLRNAGVGGLVVLVLAVAVAWWWADRMPVIDGRRAAATAVGAPVLAEVPSLRGIHSPWDADPPADSFQLAASQLEVALQSMEGRVVLITSATSGEGTTFVAAALARALADGERGVVLVDADLRSRALSQHADIGSLPGVGDMEAHSSGNPGTSIGRLRFISAGSAVTDPARFLRRRVVAEGIASAAGNGSLVVLDSPAVLEAPDAAILARQVDGAVLVMRPGRSLRSVQEAAERLRFVGVPILGVILNRVGRADRRLSGGNGNREYAPPRDRAAEEPTTVQRLAPSSGEPV